MTKRIDDMAVDEQGRPLAMAPADVRSMVKRAIDEGDVLCAVFRMRDGSLAVQVFGPPSRELLGILETATAAYRRTLEGH